MSRPHEGVEWFADEMRAKLEANDHKRGWDDLDPEFAMYRMRQEQREIGDALDQAYDQGHSDAATVSDTFAQQIVEECADVANFAMMLAWRFRREQP